MNETYEQCNLSCSDCWYGNHSDCSNQEVCKCEGITNVTDGISKENRAL